MSNFIPPSENGKIVELDYRELSDHPLLAGIPTWAPDSAEFLSLRDSIDDRGLDYELLVDNQKRLVDGRNRRNVIAVLGGLGAHRALRVPCRVVDEHEAASVIVSSLINRRHLTKSARVYLILPILDPVLAEAKARKLANLRHGNSPKPIQSASGNTLEEFAARNGFSRDLIEQARKVRALFEKHPDLREKIEPQIIAGELGLGGAIVAITNILENASRAERLGKRGEHDRLFAKFLPKLCLHWDKASTEQREHMRADLRTAMLTWPAELVDDFGKIAREVGREHAEAKAS